MIDLTRYDIFNNHLTTLKETSEDKSNAEYMTEAQIEVVNFDEVKAEYIMNLKLRNVPDSVDALFSDENGAVIFVEFKNGKINAKTKFGLQKKIYDTTLIFTDITCSRISDMRSYAKFILVYNKDKNKPDKEEGGEKIYIQPSDSMNQISKTLAGLAKEPHIQFGLEMFKNYCFKDVSTLTKEEFNNQLSEIGLH